jgi:hypothetical protein
LICSIRIKKILNPFSLTLVDFDLLFKACCLLSDILLARQCSINSGKKLVLFERKLYGIYQTIYLILFLNRTLINIK